MRLYELTPAILVARLYETLRLIVRFPCQQYLLRHSFRPDRTVRVYGRVSTG